jgi:tRNA-2-methylthio-N6-dimethylallyladenosine synthase
MNYADSERIITILENAGYQSTPLLDQAELIIVNMCSVRQKAVDRIYGLIPKIRQQKAENSHLRTILTGCISNKDQEKLKEEFDFILEKENLLSWPKLLGFPEQKNKLHHYLEVPPVYQSPFSAFVPIMTGCNNFCTFCIVPYTRGREYSRPVEKILLEINNLVQKNYKEIWLLGQNVNSFSGKTASGDVLNFSQLLILINKIPGDFWLFFTSSHPKDFSDELIETMARLSKIAPYLNLPVQSGNNRVLAAMNRSYSIEQYNEIVKKIRKSFWEKRKGLEGRISLSTDAIVGFPQETKDEFNDTVAVFEQIKYDSAHIAKFSPRPQTAAAQMTDNISHREKVKRKEKLNSVLAKTALENNRHYLSKIIPVLIEEVNRKHQFMLGRSRSYKVVKIESFNPSLLGKIILTKITNVTPWRLEAKEKSPSEIKSKR